MLTFLVDLFEIGNLGNLILDASRVEAHIRIWTLVSSPEVHWHSQAALLPTTSLATCPEAILFPSSTHCMATVAATQLAWPSMSRPGALISIGLAKVSPLSSLVSCLPPLQIPHKCSNRRISSELADLSATYTCLPTIRGSTCRWTLPCSSRSSMRSHHGRPLHAPSSTTTSSRTLQARSMWPSTSTWAVTSDHPQIPCQHHSKLRSWPARSATWLSALATTWPS